jgi:hypothetical protein
MTELRVLMGMFAVLAAVVAGEVVGRPTGESETPAASAQQAPATPAAPASPDTGRSEVWSATLLARPLFAPDRRPVAEAPSPAVVAHDTPLPRLSGIVLSPNLRFAIFEGDHATRAIVVADGGTIAGWTVAAIAPNAVTLSRDGSQPVTLRPRFVGAKPETIATNLPPPPPVSRWTNPAATGVLRTRWSNPQLQPRRRRRRRS